VLQRTVNTASVQFIHSLHPIYLMDYFYRGTCMQLSSRPKEEKKVENLKTKATISTKHINALTNALNTLCSPLSYSKTV
jgi:hypothetical protein